MVKGGHQAVHPSPPDGAPVSKRSLRAKRITMSEPNDFTSDDEEYKPNKNYKRVV